MIEIEEQSLAVMLVGSVSFCLGLVPLIPAQMKSLAIFWYFYESGLEGE